MNRLDIKKGTRFGNLVVIGDGVTKRTPKGQVNRMMRCICDCGSEKDVRLMHLTRGRTKSCGCSTTSSGKPRHHKSNTPIYTVWRGIKNRLKESYGESHLYFYKGIKMCDEWRNDFELFESWCLENGYQKGLQIDRIDNSKGYYPYNCRFVTPMENVNNRDNTKIVVYKGCSYPITTLLRSKGLDGKVSTILARINRGWSVEKSIDTPIRKHKKYKKRQKNLAKN